MRLFERAGADDVKADYDKIISASERVSWRIEDVISPDRPLDFTKRFLPEALVRAEGLSFLSAQEKLKLNQIRGNAYAHLFQFVEEYIVANCVQHVDAQIFGDETNLRAMLRFAEEEVKHQLLFKRFLQVFAQGFGSVCECVPSQEAVAGVILSKSPIAVTMTTLHLEVMTQQHFTHCVSESEETLDSTFKAMLKSHWAEESQHAKLDAINLRSLVATSTPEMRYEAVRDYIDLVDGLFDLFSRQAELDVASLVRATGKQYAPAEQSALLDSQKRAYAQTFIHWGMTNPVFVATVKELFPEDFELIAAKTQEMAQASSPLDGGERR
jgi:hypothetical protein